MIKPGRQAVQPSRTQSFRTCISTTVGMPFTQPAAVVGHPGDQNSLNLVVLTASRASHLQINHNRTLAEAVKRVGTHNWTPGSPTSSRCHGMADEPCIVRLLTGHLYPIYCTRFVIDWSRTRRRFSHQTWPCLFTVQDVDQGDVDLLHIPRTLAST